MNVEETSRTNDLKVRQLWTRVASRAGFRQLLAHTIPSLIVVSQAEKSSLSKRTPTSSQQLEWAIFLTARSRPGKTIRKLVTWSLSRERQPTYCSTFGERTSSRPRWPELPILMLILTLTRCNVKVSNLVRKKVEIENWILLNFAKINEQTGLAVDEIKCLKVCSNIFDDNPVDDEDVDGVD